MAQHHVLFLIFISSVAVLPYFILASHTLEQKNEVDARKRVRRDMGNAPRIAAKFCHIQDIDAFNIEVMRHIPNFKELYCPSLGIDTTVLNGSITIKGGVKSLQATEINSNGKWGNTVSLSESGSTSNSLNKNASGALRNVLTNLCIAPASYGRDIPSEIEVSFSSECVGEIYEFRYNVDGSIQHKLTTKCLGPKGGDMNPIDNTQLILTSDCKFKFDVIHRGVLQLVGSKCVHPMWGGDPKVGQKLCLYTTCTDQSRLSYSLIDNFDEEEEKEDVRSFPLETEMSYLKVNLVRDEEFQAYIETYALLVLSSKLPPMQPTEKPNIIVIVIDEASVQHVKRKLKQTNILMTNMGFIRHEQYASVASSSADHIKFLIKGDEMSLFEIASLNNYTSMFSLDNPALGKNLDVHLSHATHNSLPFFRVFKNRHMTGGNSCYCLAGNPIFNMTFNYLMSFLYAYPSNPKFSLVVLSEVCRSTFDNLAYLGYLDLQLAHTLNYLKTLENTIIIIKSLKGGTTSKLKSVRQMSEEVKRPFFAMYTSKDIRKKHPHEESRLKHLSTTYDVYATLSHIILGKQTPTKYGKSLMSKVAPTDCARAGVPADMCPCL